MMYSNEITLIKNSRGVYDLDTTKGCTSGIIHNKTGCYGECYAFRSAKRYGYEFSKHVLRKFKSVSHVESIRKQIYSINMPFIRIGVTGDPSENWKHTISIISLVYGLGKDIVVVTKHWNKLTGNQLKQLSKYKVCVNTSISAMDDKELILHRLREYKRLKNYCKSVLRVVSCDFNKNNLIGLNLKHLQDDLFNNEMTIDNVFRVNLNNELLKMNIIKFEKRQFLNTKSYFSINNKSAYTGHCNKCHDMCGINI